MELARDSIVYKLAATALTFVAVFAAIRAFDSSSAPEIGGNGEGSSQGPAATASTEERIAALQDQVRESPSDPQGFADLGLVYLKRQGETEDPAYYPEARRAFDSALSLAPRDFTATAGLAELELSRHHFRRGLALSVRARQISPSIARTDGQITDAQVELGRYLAAERTLRRYVNRRPELASYARISYFRELHGDLRGALAAMRLAASAAGEASANSSYAQTLLGKLQFDRGAYADAERIYRGVLSRDPSYPDALLGLAAVEAGRGDLQGALAHQRAVFEAVPAPDHAILLGETEQAAGNLETAEDAYAAAEVAFERLDAYGVRIATELAVFEADHGSPVEAVAAGRRAWRATRSVRAADAYSWALSAAGRDRAALRFSLRAMRLGSLDPAFLYHAGIISLRAGGERRAQALLGRLLERSPRFSPLQAPRARAALNRLN
jgi:cytochrome c-type biogenesis protein CcmH/NrfG